MGKKESGHGLRLSRQQFSMEWSENQQVEYKGRVSGMKATYFARSIDRRQFIRDAAMTIAGLALSTSALGGCAHFVEDHPIHYPELPGRKIQSPESYGLEGCMLGFFNDTIQGTSRPSVGYDINKRIIENTILEYEAKIDKTPSILLLGHRWTKLSEFGNEFPFGQAVGAAEMGVIPFVTYDPIDYSFHPADVRFSLDRILEGKTDDLIRGFASQVRDFGEEHGGLFIRTMREMNLHNAWPWSGTADEVKETWRHIWWVFENEGANEYATWVWDVCVQEMKANWALNANYFYPGEEYVDWVGMNGHNFGSSQSWSEWQSFDELFSQGYSIMRHSHPTKPIMINETGCSEERGKPKWVKDAFRTIQKEYRGVKAMVWLDKRWSQKTIRDLNSRIDSSPEALQAFKKAVANRHFLGKVPYRKDMRG